MKRILIVDDFQPGRLVLRETLEMQGYSCQESVNGLEALNTLKIKQFDLIITDNAMPVMTGLEMAQSLATTPLNQRTPIILLTGQPSDRLYREARKTGLLAIFPKPYNEQELLSEIVRILETP